ncbi:hypothetical protein BAE44_0002695 [Dichanthelium oligosanthes]|uniref:Uncharacterized protein n=1 Tax=Dichanthelium oligosanthes TaxID=888268 RepID=A0A1E5WFU3_9POAL|nr:hypothetical protein BAE44_0002695 [Dichanthelium oligosanthes]
MFRFLRRAASWVLGRPSDPRPLSGLFLTSASPSAASHVGLARARPSLGRLLTPEALLLDATHALRAAELHDLPQERDVVAPADLARGGGPGRRQGRRGPPPPHRPSRTRSTPLRASPWRATPRAAKMPSTH